MSQKLAAILYHLINFFDKIFNLIFKRNFKYHLYNYFRKNSFTKKKIGSSNYIFFTPSQLSKWRVDTFFSKEPETLAWIDSFKNFDNKTIFWDIGANIGLYSIYAASKHDFLKKIVAFEPSTANLNLLSTNISINNLSDKIYIFNQPLSKSHENFMFLQESFVEEGGSMNAYGVNYDHAGNEFKSKMSYQLMGNSINHILRKNILEFPNYIKIDVDGIEHLILSGADEFLNDPKIKEIQVEINEDFTTQKEIIAKLMEKSNFKLKHKTNALSFASNKFANTFNYLYIKT